MYTSRVVLRLSPIRKTPFQEVLRESPHSVPLGVHVVARRVRAQVARLVASDLLHHVPFEEPVPGIEQGAAKEGDRGGTPARVLLELLDIALGLRGVAVGGQTDREERRREPLENSQVLPNEVPDVTVVPAHMNGRPDDDRIVTIRDSVSRSFDV